MGERGRIPKNKLGKAASSSNPVPVAIVAHRSGEFKQSKEDKDRERRYRAEDALRDIERAEGHKKDKQLMSDVKDLCKEKADNMKNLMKKV